MKHDYIPTCKQLQTIHRMMSIALTRFVHNRTNHRFICTMVSDICVQRHRRMNLDKLLKRFIFPSMVYDYDYDYGYKIENRNRTLKRLRRMECWLEDDSWAYHGSDPEKAQVAKTQRIMLLQWCLLELEELIAEQTAKGAV